MPTLSSGDTLSLNNLAGATAIGTQESSVSLGAQADNGTPSAGDNISLSSFAVDSMDSIGGFTYGVEGTTETYEAIFSGAGTRFIEIKQNGNNFTWQRTSGDTVGTTPSNGANYLAEFEFLNNGDNGTQETRNTVTSNTIAVVWADGYNDHLTALEGYNKTTSPISKTVYSVDSYDGHASSLCLTADSPILLADGTIVDAGDLEEGDVLKGYSLSGLSADSDGTFLDWSTSELGEAIKDVQVVNLTYSFASRYYNVNNGEITATAEHPMLVKDSVDGLFRFKEIHSLVIGDKLIKSDNGTITEVAITSIESTDSTVEIVSIDVEEQDTYLVNGYITHNKGTNSWSDFTGPSAPTSLTYNNPGGAQNSNLSWTAPAATGTTGATEYELQVDNDNGFTSLDATHSMVLSETSLNVSGLATATYYARVRAKEMGVWGAWSTSISFAHTFEN
jgi:hypothetical protein